MQKLPSVAFILPPVFVGVFEWLFSCLHVIGVRDEDIILSCNSCGSLLPKAICSRLIERTYLHSECRGACIMYLMVDFDWHV